MIIDVIDMQDPKSGSEVKRGLSGTDSKVVCLYGMSNGIGQMITEVINAAGMVYSIDALRIWAHGTSGSQVLSSGEYLMEEHWCGIDVSMIREIEPTLKRLAPYFKPGARVELRGCNIARGKKGERLLKELARIWGVAVQAGTADQVGVNWIGPVVEASPQGTLICTTGTDI